MLVTLTKLVDYIITYFFILYLGHPKFTMNPFISVASIIIIIFVRLKIDQGTIAGQIE